MNKTHSMIYNFRLVVVCSLLIISALGVFQCSSDQKPRPAYEGSLFKEIPASKSGIDFSNQIVENSNDNFFTYQYVYNGGGVATGDFNNDGMADLYLTGNQVADKCYINKGDLTFEDITETAITTGQGGWHTGVTTVDINNDGWLDIYVCRSGKVNDPAKLENLLYINKTKKKGGKAIFEEQAKAYGLHENGQSTQAAFFDFDNDGDLDCYIINHPKEFFESMPKDQLEALINSDAAETDCLYRNDNGKFTEVTKASGIRNHAFGLGLSISDINDDGWMDIYVANDYDEPDFMYINQKNGSFKDEIKARTKHISNFGMGTDIADYNNDGYKDIVVLDMSYADHVRSKRNMAPMSTRKFWGMVASGKHFQYMTNTLQINNGNNVFSEIGQMAGIAKSDWSWGPLLADFDNDGWKDLVITNGYKRDVRDRDFQTKYANIMARSQRVTPQQLTAMMPANVVGNKLYKNNGDLTFSDQTRDWGFTNAYNSNGIAYADFDLDGDLDLIVNNMDRPASLYRNNATSNYLRIVLKGGDGNGQALGSTVTLKTATGTQVQELHSTRGYQSAVEPVLHFGLGTAKMIEEVTVKWYDGKTSKQTNVKANQLLTIDRNGVTNPVAKQENKKYLFTEITRSLGMLHRHKENLYNDFSKEILLPHKQSENGPFVDVADVNGDGREDFYIGGANGQSGAMYLQNQNGTFSAANAALWETDKNSEDLGVLFFDADKDGDDDLYVVSGGNEFAASDPALQDRLYLNDGKGNFRKTSQALPSKLISGMKIIAGDYDKDGDLDLFVGGRVVPGKYPSAPESQLLQNDNGKFTDVTPAILKAPGMVTDAQFVDMDQDDDLDLVLTGEWMSVQVYSNENGQYIDKQEIEGSNGMWFSLNVGDFDKDGDVDLIAGNLGKNHKFKGSNAKPFNCYANDFDDNGSLDIVLSSYQGETNFPLRGRECTSEQMPFIKEKFPSFESFANADVNALYSEEKLNESIHLEVKTFEHSIFRNNNGSFERTALPKAAQVSPINSILVTDVDKDGKDDFIMAGNLFGAEVETVRHDAGIGAVLIDKQDGNYTALSYQESGFYAPANAKDLKMIQIGGKPVILIANNNYVLQAFRMN